MPEQKSTILIPDISGYTEFMTTTELTHAVDRLSEAYKIRRVAVVQAIYGQRSRGPSEIAKAFRFGKKKQ